MDLYRNRAIDEEDPDVRYLALMLDAWNRQGQPDAVDFLRERALNDPDRNVRSRIKKLINAK